MMGVMPAAAQQQAAATSLPKAGAEAGGPSAPVGRALVPLDGPKVAEGAFGAARPHKAARSPITSLPSEMHMAEFDTSTKGRRDPSAMITFSAAGSDSAQVSGIHGLTGGKLGAKFDFAAGTVKLYPGKVYDHKTYGAIWACAYNEQTNTFNTSTPITGTIGADGSITLSAWGVFAVDGDYRGSSFGLYRSSELKQSNATITDVTFKTSLKTTATEQFASYVEQAGENKLNVFNVGNYCNATITVDLLADSTVSIVPQYVTSTTSADFFCYPADWASALRGIKDNITGRGTATTITLGNWGVCSRTSLATRQRNVVSSVITLTDGSTISYPAAPALDWTGSGTSASPYVITTAKQLSDFSRTVNAGNSYAGKYVRLDADIDMAAESESFKPIGSSETRCFQGVFNGDGHTVSNLTLDLGEQMGVGLFGYTGASSLVHDINIKNFNITTYGRYVGALIGYAKGSVANVNVASTSITTYYITVGGVVGYYQGTNLQNAEFDGSVSGWGSVGGIVGELRGKARQLRNHGTVTMSQYYDAAYTGVGGVAGATQNYTQGRSSITDSYNDGHVIGRSSTSYVGGVVGQLQTADVARCFNVGLINGVSSVSSSLGEGGTAGVAGRAYGATVADCYNGNYVINSYVTNNVGGIIGLVAKPASVINNGVVVRYENTSAVTRSYNSGQVVQPALYANQGLWGSCYADTVFTKCYFDRQTTGNEIGAKLASMSCLTSQLTTAKGLDGINDASVWVTADGMYPRLKGFESVTSAIVAATPAYLTDGETTQKVKHNFTVSTAGGVKWKAYDDASQTYGSQNAAFKVDGANVSLNSVTTNGIIVAMMGDDAKFYKRLWIKMINPNGFAGSGTESDPYLIKSKADLIELRNGINGSAQHYKGEHFRQTADIDLAQGEGDFSGIGTDGYSSHIFGGIYDGNGHSISNLVINGLGADSKGKASKTNSTEFVGLFGFIEQGAVVKNLTIASGDIAGWQYAGGLVGYNDGSVINCRNFATVKTAYAYSAGIAGYQSANGVVSGCYNGGTVTAGRYYSAGIVGFNCGRVTACQNAGLVNAAYVNPYKPSGQRYAAGIVAQNYGASEVSSCVNSGTVTAPLGVAGITLQLGVSGESLLKGNLNYGMVTAEESSDINGAILGTAAAAGSTVTGNCFDSQINWQGAVAMTDGEGMEPLTTAALTSGKAVSGLDASLFDFAAGMYPALKAFKAEPAVDAARRMVLTLGSGQTTDDVTSDASVASFSGLSWSLTRGDKFSLSGNTLKLSISDADKVSARDTLTASLGAYTKVLPLRAMPVLFAGKGTASDPYQIASKADMQALASSTTDDGCTYNGRYFKVMNDIDFGSDLYSPIAWGSTKFNADFDGNGKQFLNVTYGNQSTQYVAMFGEVGAKARLHDFTLASGSIGAAGYTAGIAAEVFGTVENVVNKADVTTLKNGYLAGIAAIVKKGGRLINCRNEGAITPTANYAAGVAYSVEQGGLVDGCVNVADITSAKDYLGGVVATSAGMVRNCVNRGAISGKTNVGGVIGAVAGADSTVSCRNEGAVTASAGRVGGIVGYKSATADPSVLINCLNTGLITSAKGAVGGVAGRMQEGTYAYGCGNSGEVVNTGSTYTGGVFGSLESIAAKPSLAQGCYNTGKVTNSGNGSYTGGVSGNTNQNTNYIDCFNTADVYSGGNYVGGISSGLSGKVVHCYNTGNVVAKGIAVGGLSGLGWAEVYESYNLGDVTSTDGDSKNGVAGGLWGYGRVKFYNCYNMGTVTGKSYTGGISGGVADDFTVVNTYNAGRLVVTDTATCGQIAPGGDYKITVSNAYYDTDVNGFGPISNVDSLASGVTTRSLALTNPCDTAFVVAPGMYPTLAAFQSDTLANWFAAVPVVAQGDSYGHISSAFTVGTPAGTEWTMSGNLFINGNTVDSNAEGDSWITKTYGPHTRTYTLHIDRATGIDGTVADAALKSRVYYTVSGISLGAVRPSSAGAYVERSVYSNGAVRSRVIVVR